MKHPAYIWTDPAGVIHDLTTDVRLSIGEAATILRRSESTVRRIAARGELHPLYRDDGHLEIFGCVLSSYIASHIETERKAA